MAIRHSLPLLAGLAAAGILLGASGARAQSDVLHFEAQTWQKTTAPGDVAQFVVDVTNQSSETIQLYVRRTASTLPDTNDWYSALCFNGLCYSKDLSSPPPAELPAGATLHFELSVQTGFEPNSTGHVTVSFAPGLFAESIDKEFTVSVDPSVSSVGPGSAVAHSAAAYPNPATSVVSIPLPAASRAKGAMLELCDVTGNRIADLSDRASAAIAAGADNVAIDLSGQPNGRYFFRLMVNGHRTTGPIIIAR